MIGVRWMDLFIMFMCYGLAIFSLYTIRDDMTNVDETLVFFVAILIVAQGQALNLRLEMYQKKEDKHEE